MATSQEILNYLASNSGVGRQVNSEIIPQGWSRRSDDGNTVYWVDENGNRARTPSNEFEITPEEYFQRYLATNNTVPAGLNSARDPNWTGDKIMAAITRGDFGPEMQQYLKMAQAGGRQGNPENGAFDTTPSFYNQQGAWLGHLLSSPNEQYAHKLYDSISSDPHAQRMGNQNAPGIFNAALAAVTAGAGSAALGAGAAADTIGSGLSMAGGEAAAGAGAGLGMGGTAAAATGYSGAWGAIEQSLGLPPGTLSGASTANSGMQLASAAGNTATDVTAGTTGPLASGPLMPPATVEADPTFGGNLTQTSPGVFTAAAGGAAAGAGGAAASTALSRLLSGEGNASDYLTALGLGGGALLGGLAANSKPAGTTTTVQDIPDWLKPYVMGNLNQALTARNSLTAAGNPVTDAATPEMVKTINGAYLDPETNPYLDKTYNHAAGLVGAGVDSRFTAAGRYGSGAHQGVLQEGFNNLATNIFGGNYQAERARQVAAATGAPTYDAGRSSAAYAPYIDYAKLFPNSRSTETPYFTNTAGGILGGAAAGSQLVKALG